MAGPVYAKRLWLRIREVEVGYTIAGGHKGKTVPELLIANYPLAV